MACMRPKKGFPIGKTDSGKVKYLIRNWNTDHVEKDGERWITAETPAVRPGNIAVTDWIPIPCGKCYACKMKYAKDWTMRLMLEKECYSDDECWFATLTYNDVELPRVQSANSLGECIEKPSLRPKDMQDFFKRVRSNFSPVRVFYCGEYGSLRGRPHYHAVIFGLRLPDAKVSKISKSGEPLFRSESLEKCWCRIDGDNEKHLLGFVELGKVTDRSCAYVAQYCMKKAKSKTTDPYIEPEFIRMSRRPGIGLAGIDKVSVLTQLGSNQYMVPRYYLKHLEESDPEKYKEFHDRLQKLGEQSQRNMSFLLGFDVGSSGRTGLRYVQYLRDAEEKKLAEMKLRM